MWVLSQYLSIPGTPKQKRCDSCGGGGGNRGNNGAGARRSDPNGLSLRELMQLLPFLSGFNSAPVAASTITHLPFPALTPLSAPGPIGPLAAANLAAGPLPVANPNKDALGAIAQLAKVITRRQVDQARIIAEARSYMAKMMAATPPKVLHSQNRSPMEGVPGGQTTTPSRILVVHANTSLGAKNDTESGHMDRYEIEDYGPPPAPGQLGHYVRKGHIGEACQSDEDCARGATCRNSSKEPSGQKRCECRLPFVRSNGRCVLSAPDRRE